MLLLSTGGDFLLPVNPGGMLPGRYAFRRTDDCKEDCGRCGSPDHHRPPGIVLRTEGREISGSNSGIE